MAGINSGRSGRIWRELSARLKVELPPVCHICGKDIDLTLHYNDPAAWTLDHVIPLVERPDLAEDPANLRPAHRGCNSSKGKGSSTARALVRSSRMWH